MVASEHRMESIKPAEVPQIHIVLGLGVMKTMYYVPISLQIKPPLVYTHRQILSPGQNPQNRVKVFIFSQLYRCRFHVASVIDGGLLDQFFLSLKSKLWTDAVAPKIYFKSEFSH